MKKQGFVYILFNRKNGTLYVGVTSDLIKRIYQHKNKLIEGFSKKYGLDKLGYYEIYENIENAILREKQIKSGSRKNKINLIEKVNPNWEDLYNSLL
ncbi:GIY-YIG nuclease family protein [Brachyspira aalborgi]|uniref:GIY-YIG nuclease family protein n=1 Tax=Brachyspira aalborgi TaxID=29522 RepID=A0A5C8GCT8_9SPIR|nr:GIY-YIG nuclease family protein [Brachyspira aalborgi]TXJ59569.1 GIY-YIG nuclease family protein [Brachyspira aalborgi]